MNRVEALIRDFAEQLQAVVRGQLTEEVTAAVQAALGSQSKGGKNGRVGRSARAARGGKRTPEQIEKLAARLLVYIGKNPDQRAEQLAKANKLTTGELVLPIKRLLDDKKIKASGKARGTTYAVVK